MYLLFNADLLYCPPHPVMDSLSSQRTRFVVSSKCWLFEYIVIMNLSRLYSCVCVAE